MSLNLDFKVQKEQKVREIEDSLHRIVVYDQIQGLMTTR